MDLNFKDVISFLENPCLPTQQHYLYINIPARIEPNAKPFYLKIPEFGISVKSDNLMAKKVNNLTHLQLIDNVQNCWNFADGIIFPIGKPKQNFDIMACWKIQEQEDLTNAEYTIRCLIDDLDILNSFQNAKVVMWEMIDSEYQPMIFRVCDFADDELKHNKSFIVEQKASLHIYPRTNTTN